MIKQSKLGGKKIEFLNLLRATAMLLVVWDHMVAFWLETAGRTWLPATIINKFVNKPLVIIQYFGFFGVALFFLVSGFVITYVSQKEGRIEFLIKRVLRIFPPLFISTFAFYLFQKFIEIIQGHPTYWAAVTFKQWVLGSTLGNYFLNLDNSVNGVTWTLIIEVCFYILCFIFLNFIKKYHLMSTILMLSVVIFAVMLKKYLGIDHILLRSVSYITYLIFGQLIYYVWSNKIKIVSFAILSLTNYFLTIVCTREFNPQYYEANESYGVSFIYAYLIFIIALLLNDKIKLNKWFTMLSDLSYASYLNHMTFGSLCLSLTLPLYDILGYTPMIILAVLFVFIISYVQFRFVEKPFMNIAKKLSAAINLRSSSIIKIQNDIEKTT